MRESKCGYAEAHDLKMYYEIHGTGHPLVLLHGGLSAIGTSFGKVLPGLVKTRQVIAVEQQGHGHTADIDRPFTIEQMAADTVALLAQIGIEQADFFGYSNGGALALRITIEHSELVRKLVIATPGYNRDGFHPGVLEGIGDVQPEHLIGTPWQEEYARIAPHAGDWPTLIAKTKGLDQRFKSWSREAIQSIQAPTLLIAGDADVVRLEHVVEMLHLLGGGVPGESSASPRSQLAILPGTTHETLVDRADWLVSMITQFLDTPLPVVK